MQTYLLVAFLLVSVVPIMLLAVVLAVSDDQRREQEARARLQETAGVFAQEVDQYLASHRSAIAVLPQVVALAKPAERTAALHQHHAEYPGFYTMLIADANGNVVASEGSITAAGEDGATKARDTKRSVADREYFLAARDTFQPYVSNAFRGRTFGSDPIVAISAPVFDERGRFNGIVEGSLNLRRFRRLEAHYRDLEGVEIILLDGRDQVVYATSRAGLRPLEVRTGSPMLRAAEAALDPASFYFEKPIEGRSVEFLASQQALTHVPWRVFVRQRVSALRTATQRYYLLTLVWTLAAIFLCFILARMAAQRVTRPLGRLAESVREFQLTGAPGRAALPRDAPAEVADLIGGFEEMQERLGRSLQGLLPICSSCKKIRDEQGQWNAIESYVRARSEVDFTHGICPDCARRLYPDDYKS